MCKDDFGKHLQNTHKKQGFIHNLTCGGLVVSPLPHLFFPFWIIQELDESDIPKTAWDSIMNSKMAYLRSLGHTK